MTYRLVHSLAILGIAVLIVLAPILAFASADCQPTTFCDTHRKSAFFIGTKYVNGKCYCRYKHSNPEHTVLEKCE